MSDFTINIDSKLNLNSTKTEIENFISTYNKKPIKIKIKLDSNSINAGNLGKQLQSQLNNINNIKIKPTIDTSEAKQAAKDFQMVKNLANEISKTKIKIAGLDTSKNSNELSVLQSQLTKMESDYNVLMKTFSSGFNRSQFGSLENILKNADDRIDQIKAKAKDLENTFNSTNNIQKQFETAQSKFNSLQSAFNNSSQSILGANGYNQIQAYLTQAASAAERFNVEISKGESVNLNSLNADMKEFISLTNKATSEYNKLNTPASIVKQQNTLNDFKKWMNNNPKAYKIGGTRYNSIISDLQGNLTSGQLEEFISQIKAFKTEMELTGNVGKSTLGEIGRGFKQIGQFALTYGTIQRIAYDVPRQLANSVLEVDTAMTELRKVSDDFEDGKINQYFDHATESAKKYGAAINEVINSTADWKRLGYSIDDASKLSDATTLLQRVGDNMTQESSSQGLISILKGYNLQAGQVNQVIDVINQVANTEPIDTSGIVSALQRSASSLSAAGNDLNQSVSMITAANSVVQDPDTVGTAFRTLSMRIRGAKTELEDANLDTEGMAESTAKLREEIKALSGVDIMIDNDTFKSTYDILGALADKWSELTDIQQASITELIAGKRQGNIMSALMTNWDIVEDTMKQASNADGSAEKELSNYQQSLQYSLDKMKATAQEFSNVTLDSSWLKTGVDTAQTLLNILTQIEANAGVIPLIFGGTAVVKAVKNFDKSNDFVLYGCESIVA